MSQTRICCPACGYPQCWCQCKGKGLQMQTYTFHRAEGFYIMEFPTDEVARVNALCNEGTLRVVNVITKAEIYSA